MVLGVQAGQSIQEVINAAKPGDVILIDPGTYEGEIVVNTEDITIRGKDRNNVVIDGEYEQDNGIVVAADGVRIENLTVQRFRTNGVLVAGGYNDEVLEANEDSVVSRFLVEYVNAMNNGLYGIYAFSATEGTIANTFTRANADAGIYVGQCKPCNTQVYNNIAYVNGIGFQGANNSEGMYIFNNNFSNNRTGIQILSETKERLSPQTSANIVGNRTDSNNNADAPTTTSDIFGFGIIIVGGENNFIERNKADSNVQAGILIISTEDFSAKNNTIDSNSALGNGSPFGFDIGYLFEGRTEVQKLGNCFKNNTFASSSIERIQQVLSCDADSNELIRFKPLRPYDVPQAPNYNDIGIEVQSREGKPGDITAIPKKLEKVEFIDLKELKLPNGNTGI